MSVSRTSHYTPRSSASQGRIVTTNSALSAQLRDDSREVVVPPSEGFPVNSHALNVVSSDVVNNSPNTDRDKVEYVVVSKSRLSLNTNTDIPDNHSSNNTDLEQANEHPPTLVNHTNQLQTTPPRQQANVTETDSAVVEQSVDKYSRGEHSTVEHSRGEQSVDEHSRGDISNRYSYHSLKRSGNVSRNSTNSNALINQSQLQTGLNGVGTNSTHGARADSNAVPLTDNSYPDGDSVNEINNGSSSLLRSPISNEPSQRETQRQGHKVSSAQRNNSDALQGEGHISEHRLKAQQHTRLSLYSQPESSVSRFPEPHSVDINDQSVPPLDLSRLSGRQPPASDSDSEPVTPTPQTSQPTLPLNQNLHASDPSSPLVHFTPHVNRGTARTYEVASPYDSQQLPHVKSSANFRGPQDTNRDHRGPYDQDTFREREQDKPSKVGSIHSDLADDLRVPYQFDTQAQEDKNGGYYDKPPSPPVPHSPTPDREPATSLRNNSQVYAVANPEILRAQGINPPPNSQFTPRQYSSNTRKQSESGVRFDSASRHQPGSRGQNSPVRDRAPTPYNRSPPRSPGEYRPRSPPGEEQRHNKPGSRGSRNTLPPQHPPLDTKHSHSTSARTEHRQDLRNKLEDTGSVKRVYVESPTFTKAEEDEYRFVDSRLEEAEEKEQATFRDMERNKRGYADHGDYDRSHKDREHRNRDRGEDYYRKPAEQERFSDKNRDRYEDRNQGQYEDRGHDMNGYGHREQDRQGDRHRNDKGNDWSNYRDNDRYEDRNKYDPYNTTGKYEQLKDERSRYDREPHREEDPDFRQGYRKQNTEMDAEDLRKEQAYQADLKRRLDKQKIKENDYIPPQDRMAYKNDNFVRDSLEYPEERDKGFARDSLDYNNYVNQGGQEWDDPPPNPYPDQQDQYYGKDFDNRQFMKEDSKPAFYDPVDAAKMEVVNPTEPKYDFVNLNKHDYGVPPKKSYREIVHKKKEEEEKLDKIFITPKVPPKQGKKKKAQSAQPEHMGYQPPVQDQYPLGFKPSSAEELWAMRSNTLQNQSAGSKKGKGSASKPSAQKWNSNPNIKHQHNIQAPPALPRQAQPYKPPNMNYPASPSGSNGGQGYTTPTRYLQPMENKPAAPVSTEYVPTALEPNSPFRRHMELKPITQEIVTDDGQRISVDINLRLVSPPPGHNHSPPPGQQQMALVPVQETQGQADPNENRAIGVPYTLQNQYGYDNGYPAYSEEIQGDYQGNGGLALEGTYNIEDQIAQEQMALAELTGNTGYAKRHAAGSSSYRDDESMENNESGYSAMYHKNKSKDPNEKPWYKVYDISDYKKMQREVRLNRGTLGPDLDTEPYKEKLEKRHKQFEYARMVMEKNREELASNKPPKFPRSPDKQGEENVKRKAALDYSKTIPKPSVKPRPNQYNSYEVAAQLGVGAQASPKARRTSPTSKGSQQPTKTLDIIDIHTLEQRHLQERKNADKIKQNMEGARPQKAN